MVQGEISNQLLGKRRMDEQSIWLPLGKARKIGFEFTGLADSKRLDLDIACLGCNLDMFKQNRAETRVSIYEHGDAPRNG